MLEVFVERGLVGRLIFLEGRSYLRQQVLVEEMRGLAALCVHDAVECKVQMGLVELEQLLKEGFQLLVFLAHPVFRPLRFIVGTPAYLTSQRIVKNVSVEVCCAIRFSSDAIN